jgi:hypothetical protein
MKAAARYRVWRYPVQSWPLDTNSPQKRRKPRVRCLQIVSGIFVSNPVQKAAGQKETRMFPGSNSCPIMSLLKKGRWRSDRISTTATH